MIVLAWQHATLLRRCLTMLATNVSGDVPFETIVVCNGASEEVLAVVEEEVSGARIVRSPVNLGFAGGCNEGRAAARSELIVLLNDDAEVCRGWLESLVATADAHPEAGAVGALIRFPDGSVQEAGCVVWSDGSTTPVGRGQPDITAEQAYLRRVPYCSACSLLVRAATWDAAGGMDEGYFPGYFEDVDLCLAIAALGQTVLYDPEAGVLHHESASLETRYKHFVFGRGQARFQSKWAAALATLPAPAAHSEAGVRHAVQAARGHQRRVLVIDDRLPDPGAGSGFGRMFETVAALVGSGATVDVFPSDPTDHDFTALGRLGVQVLGGDLIAYLEAPATLYDTVIVSRPNNFDRYAAAVRRTQPYANLIYDAEAIYHRRLERQLALADDEVTAARLNEELVAVRDLEHRIAVEADQLVSISAEEGALLAAVAGHAPVRVVEPSARPGQFTPAGFAERADLLMVAGWLSGADSPNGDGLLWFARHVLPLVRAAIPWVRLRVTGARPPATLTQLSGPSITFVGYADDLAPLYGSARVAIAPIRYGAGVKLKVVDALAHGVPVVSTTVGAEGIAAPLRRAVLVADEPPEFARLLVTLLESRAAWEQQRQRVLAAVATAGEPPASPWPALIADVRQRQVATLMSDRATP